MDLKILLLEDSSSDADLITYQLKKDKLSFITERVDSREEFLEALNVFNPDVILSDHSLPQFNSLAALEIAKIKTPNVPFILVTGAVSEEFAVTCIKSGADDYILKSNLTRLPSAIRSSLAKHQLESENTTIKNLNREIAKKNKELHYLNQEKDRFISIISHDIQNHISSMLHSFDLLERNGGEGVSDKQSTYIKNLHRSASNMQTLISDFLTVNRIQRGIINPVYNLVMISNLVQDVVERYEDIAKRKQIELEYVSDHRDCCIRTDMSYYSIIADNLISNAIKYSFPGKKVRVELNKKDNNYHLAVKDEGPGIPASDLPKMYSRFQKLTPKPTGNEPSNGLGLSIVKDLADALQGTVECQSEVGKGTTFIVSLKV